MTICLNGLSGCTGLQWKRSQIKITCFLCQRLRYAIFIFSLKRILHLRDPLISGDSGRERHNTCWMGCSAIDHGAGLHRCREGSMSCICSMHQMFHFPCLASYLQQNSKYSSITCLCWNFLATTYTDIYYCICLQTINVSLDH